MCATKKLPDLTVRRLRRTLTLVVMAGSLVGAISSSAAESPRKETNRGPVASYLAGRHAMAEGDYASAAKLLGTALADNPNDAELLRRTYQLALARGDMKSALRLAEQMRASGSSSFPSGLMLVADLVARGRLPEARERLTQLPTDGIGQLVLPMVDAWLRVAAGENDQAVAALSKLAEAPGLAGLVAQQSALIHDFIGRPDEAERNYLTAMENALPLRLVQLVGNFYERQGRPDAARNVFARFLSANPDHVVALEGKAAIGPAKPKPIIANATSGLAEALYEIAAALHQEGRNEQMLAYARISQLLRGDEPLARLVAADALISRERPIEALAEFRAIAQSPTVSSGLKWLVQLRESDALRQSGQLDEAARLLQSLATKRPDRTDALVRLADLHRLQKRENEAIIAYTGAINRLQKPGPNDWYLFYARALSLDTAKRWPEAEADLKQAMVLRPDHPQILNYLGYSWIDRGMNLDEALALVERAVALRPDDGYIVDSLGWARFKLADYHRAITHLERAAELRPFDPTINDHLGDAYWAVGREVEARFQWERAARLAEDDALRQSAETKLREGLKLPQTAGTPDAPNPAAAPN